MRYNAEQVEAHMQRFDENLNPSNKYMLQILDKLTIKDIPAAISYIDPLTGEIRTATNICSIVNKSKDGREHIAFSKISKKIIWGFLDLANKFFPFLED